jgi:aspartate aminotransferase
MMALSQRLQAVEPSATTAFTALVDAERRRGREIINLAVGEYHGRAADAVTEAVGTALAGGDYRYGPVAGIMELRERIASRYAGRRTAHVAVTNGAKQALYGIMQMICDPGSEVIIPSPAWVSFPQMVRLAGGVPVMVPTADHLPDIEKIAAAVTKRTRAILINTPNNPTGAVYPEKHMHALRDLARRRDLYLIGDETYADLVYGNARHTSVLDPPDPDDRVILVGSFSKTYAMTGFRIGYLVAAPGIIDTMTILQSHSTGNVCTFAQHGAIAALETPASAIAEIRAELEANRDAAIRLISEKLPCRCPEGAFYLFPDVSGHLEPGISTADLCARLLQETGVAVVPGDAFGDPRCVRISFSMDRSTLISGVSRWLEAL